MLQCNGNSSNALTYVGVITREGGNTDIAIDLLRANFIQLIIFPSGLYLQFDKTNAIVQRLQYSGSIAIAGTASEEVVPARHLSTQWISVSVLYDGIHLGVICNYRQYR